MHLWNCLYSQSQRRLQGIVHQHGDGYRRQIRLLAEPENTQRHDSESDQQTQSDSNVRGRPTWTAAAETGSPWCPNWSQMAETWSTPGPKTQHRPESLSRSTVVQMVVLLLVLQGQQNRVRTFWLLLKGLPSSHRRMASSEEEHCTVAETSPWNMNTGSIKTTSLSVHLSGAWSWSCVRPVQCLSAPY